ncbi:calcium-binding protein [Roseomonas sp. AR75]|uniref:calcium-binding protein n=1 Tax=Roseomonas sp. AR75 TaxID=2562311 RepID=UPI0010BFD32B|nr:calcium-binding protein [Roseomonas sp. AR75]
MPGGLDFQRAKVQISNHFEGPNFVNGLAKQSASYTVLSDTAARLEFKGGFNDAITYVQILYGNGFGLDENGRYTGTVTAYLGYEKDTPENRWRFTNLETSLDKLNTLVSDPDVTFGDLLLIPLEYRFVGAQFDDVFINGSFNDIALGLDGDDNFDGLSGADTLLGHAGDDLLTGGDGDDLLLGGEDNDVLLGGTGRDSLYADTGADSLRGGADSDLAFGGAGADLLQGEEGADTLHGGADADTIEGGDGPDSIAGDQGNDMLLGGAEGDTIDGGAGNDWVQGDGGTNILFGGNGHDTVLGDSGSDELFGGAGSDSLASGAGADFLNGGFGRDMLSGNIPGGDKAVDTFIFEGAFGYDVITDFEIGFDGIVLAAGIQAEDVTTTTRGDDVILRVDFLGTQTLLVLGVAALFNTAIDVTIG